LKGEEKRERERERERKLAKNLSLLLYFIDRVASTLERKESLVDDFTMR
jgi:hypothetical protein